MSLLPPGPEDPAAFFEALFDRGPIPMVVAGAEMTIIRANEPFAKLLGYPRGELAGKSIRALTHPEDADIDVQILQRAAAKQEGFRQITKRYVRADGQVVWAETTLVMFRNPSGSMRGIAFVNDITARHKMEEELRRSNERFGLVARATRDLVYEWDVASGAINWNEVIETRFGHPDTAATRSISFWEAQLHPDDRERIAQDLGRAVQSTNELWSGEYRFRRADGTWADVFDRGLFVRDGQGRPQRMIGVMIDVTDVHAAQAQLRQVDRLAAVGTLAAGVAHEVNNPLSFVMSNLGVAGRALEALRQAGEPVHPDALLKLEEPLHDALEGARRVAAIVRDLKTFARPEEDQRAPVSLPHVLETALSLAQNELRHRARVERDFRSAPLAAANEARLEQVFLNLLVNAAQALPEGHAAEHVIRVGVRASPDGRVEGWVGDSGTGIPEDVLPHIFDPFFTTKPPGVGSGLGLAICHGIVASLDGDIQVETSSHGTTFHVFLPAAQGDAVPAPEPVAVSPERPARILVIDDEPLVGRALKRALDRHDVVLAQSAVDGLARAAGGGWDLILCDVMMPDMTGMEFFAHLRERAPTAARKVVFMSGGAFTPRAQDFLSSTAIPALEKPFDATAVERVLALLRAAEG